MCTLQNDGVQSNIGKESKCTTKRVEEGVCIMSESLRLSKAKKCINQCLENQLQSILGCISCDIYKNVLITNLLSVSMMLLIVQLYFRPRGFWTWTVLFSVLCLCVFFERNTQKFQRLMILLLCNHTHPPYTMYTICRHSLNGHLLN